MDAYREQGIIVTAARTEAEYQAGKFGVYMPPPGVYLHNEAVYIKTEDAPPQPTEGGDANYSS